MQTKKKAIILMTDLHYQGETNYSYTMKTEKNINGILGHFLWVFLGTEKQIDGKTTATVLLKYH